MQQVEPFRPHFVIYDKKILKFVGYFRQHVPESHTERYRTRYVNIFYFLEDDTITVIEPNIKVNSWRGADGFVSDEVMLTSSLFLFL